MTKTASRRTADFTDPYHRTGSENPVRQVPSIRYVSANVAIEALNQLFNDAVEFQGIEPNAIYDAWNIFSQAGRLMGNVTTYDTATDLAWTNQGTARVTLNGGTLTSDYGVKFPMTAGTASTIGGANVLTAALSSISPTKLPSVDQAVGTVETAFAWAAFSDSILEDSRRMSETEQNAAADAVWEDFD
jgi:hypothetical protein